MHDTFAFDLLVWRSGESLPRTNQSFASMSWIITVDPAPCSLANTAAWLLNFVNSKSLFETDRWTLLSNLHWRNDNLLLDIYVDVYRAIECSIGHQTHQTTGLLCQDICGIFRNATLDGAGDGAITDRHRCWRGDSRHSIVWTAWIVRMSDSKLFSFIGVITAGIHKLVRHFALLFIACLADIWHQRIHAFVSRQPGYCQRCDFSLIQLATHGATDGMICYPFCGI